jgi:hypothetical protein
MVMIEEVNSIDLPAVVVNPGADNEKEKTNSCAKKVKMF